MVLDYSRWDKIELSDDSDIEVHPNVDKRSFIRAKQNQIHEQRYLRRKEIAELKSERQINAHLLTRVQRLVSILENHAVASSSTGNSDEVVFKSLIEVTSEPDPADHPKGAPSYSQMVASLVDTVKKDVDKDFEGQTDVDTATRFQGFVRHLKVHISKIEAIQKENAVKLANLEKEEAAKITTDSLKDGFSAGHVNKAKNEPPPPPEPKPKKKKKTETSKVQAVEVLNPHALQSSSSSSKPGFDSVSSGAEADIDEPPADDEDEDDEEDEYEASSLGKQFAAIPVGDYRTCLQFISEHPGVVAEKETDGLLVEAFNAQLKGGKDSYARQCVHQALLLQYCRQLGKDGVQLFFKRITTPNHQAQRVFLEDVTTTYNRIRTRAKEINASRAAEEASAGVEQIQLHAVNPGQTISIGIPSPNPKTDEEKKARELFESFPPGLRKALESGKLDEVNKVLGKMSVDEAEEVVGKLGDGGMLNVEEQIIDATTQEGQDMLKELEKQGAIKTEKMDGVMEEKESEAADREKTA